MSDLTILGVRHHGPGSARSVTAALDELAPDLVLIEGPAELDGLIELAASPKLVPPVAALVYAVDQPRAAMFYPLARFSPEWVALRWALSRRVPVRFADLAATHQLAIQIAAEQAAVEQAERAEQEMEADLDATAADREIADGGEVADDGEESDSPSLTAARPDLIADLAQAAGYSDAERWWEDAVEHRHDSALANFHALGQAVALARDDQAHPLDIETARREAAMRKAIRAARRAGHERIAFICGAFHAPALDPSTFPSAAADNKLLAKLAKVKVAATWSPWTSRRLAYASGYGAGVDAPGWYDHLFATWESGSDDPAPSWLVRVAHELRTQQIDAPPASLVEAARLANTLAVVRGRPSVGLAELDDAVLTTLCGGSTLPLQLVRDRLTVGDSLGQVPPETPMVPLAADLVKLTKSLRLKRAATVTEVSLDLRREAQLARSVLFHRLVLLGVAWAEPAPVASTGTFKEAWTLQWRPELEVAVIEASGHGTTVVAAADAVARARAEQAPGLADLARLLHDCLLADLRQALAEVTRRLDEAAAQQHDVPALLAAIEPLAGSVRYGDVRGLDLAALSTALHALVVRACVGLRTACVSLDDDAAAQMRAGIESAQRGIELLELDSLTEPWRDALQRVAADDAVHGSVSGRAVRILLEAGRRTNDEVAVMMSARLSGPDAVQAAAWLDGFLTGDALLLLYDDRLLAVINDWVNAVADERFEDLLPLVRRTFSQFSNAERRQLAAAAARIGSGGSAEHATSADSYDRERAGPAVAAVAGLLGLTREGVR
ncbi:MAG: DUF5682 family protein [Beutenbergiaceae bacterium]